MAVSYGPTNGGTFTALNVSTTQLLRAGKGNLVSVSILTVGSAGSLTFNDVATLAGAATANVMVSIPFGSLTVGYPLNMNWFPYLAGLVLSAIPTGGVIAIAYA